MSQNNIYIYSADIFWYAPKFYLSNPKIVQ